MKPEELSIYIGEIDDDLIFLNAVRRCQSNLAFKKVMYFPDNVFICRVVLHMIWSPLAVHQDERNAGICDHADHVGIVGETGNIIDDVRSQIDHSLCGFRVSCINRNQDVGVFAF